MAGRGPQRKVQCHRSWQQQANLLTKKVRPRLAELRYGCILVAALLVCGSLAGASHRRGSASWSIPVEISLHELAEAIERIEGARRPRRAARGERFCRDRPFAARGRVSSRHADRVRGGLRRFRRGVAGLGGRAFGVDGRRGARGDRPGANVLSARRGGLGHRTRAVDPRAAGERPRRTLGARPGVAFSRGSGGACLAGQQAGQRLSPLATRGRSRRRSDAVRAARCRSPRAKLGGSSLCRHAGR